MNVRIILLMKRFCDYIIKKGHDIKIIEQIIGVIRTEKTMKKINTQINRNNETS